MTEPASTRQEEHVDEDDELGKAIEQAPQPAAAVPAVSREASLPLEDSLAEERAAVEGQADPSG